MIESRLSLFATDRFHIFSGASSPVMTNGCEYIGGGPNGEKNMLVRTRKRLSSTMSMSRWPKQWATTGLNSAESVPIILTTARFYILVFRCIKFSHQLWTGSQTSLGPAHCSEVLGKGCLRNWFRSANTIQLSMPVSLFVSTCWFASCGRPQFGGPISKNYFVHTLLLCHLVTKGYD